MTKNKKPIVARSLAKYSPLLLLALAIGASLYWQTLPASSSGGLTAFTVEQGETAKTIADNLRRAGLIRSPLYFRYLVRRWNLTLQAGLYHLSPSSSPRLLAMSLTSGRTQDHRLTIPEGFRLEQIAEVANLDPSEFATAAKGLEGQLFPDTYFVNSSLTSVELVKLMHDNFLAKVGEVDQKTLILASLVERETRGDEEKPLVAGILKKRLESGWPLELDATIQYSLGTNKEWWPKTTLADRQVVSPFNTYLNQGLPPQAICNPGLSSIRAVQNSSESPYWFYLHDKNGNIHYASTNREHTENIDKYLR